MESLYNFDPNRDLGFDAGRGLDFDGGRDLEFRASRDLDFTVNRDLGFGARGVVFRPMSPETPSAAREAETAPAEIRMPAAQPNSRSAPRFCPYCGVEWRVGQDACWNCHSRAVGGRQVTRMPSKATRPVSRAWRGAGEG